MCAFHLQCAPQPLQPQATVLIGRNDTETITASLTIHPFAATYIFDEHKPRTQATMAHVCCITQQSASSLTCSKHQQQSTYCMPGLTCFNEEQRVVVMLTCSCNNSSIKSVQGLQHLGQRWLWLVAVQVLLPKVVLPMVVLALVVMPLAPPQLLQLFQFVVLLAQFGVVQHILPELLMGYQHPLQLPHLQRQLPRALLLRLQVLLAQRHGAPA
jgi:hypothetical protein